MGIPVGYDLETNNTKGPNASKRMHPAFGNEIVMEGWNDGVPMYGHWGRRRVAWKGAGGGAPWFPVGHNLKFDFGFLYHDINEDFLRMLANDTPVWDTQVAEYVNGNGLKSLEAACELHGAPFKKDDEIKAYWEEGYDTEAIPRDKLAEYLKEDVRATKDLFDKQREAYKNHKLIHDMSRVSMALAFIEQEGMYVDEDKLIAYAEELLDEQCELETKVLKNLADRGWPEQVEFKPNSAAHLQVLFFGGEVAYKEKQCVGKYKNGKDKFRNVEVASKVVAPRNHGELVLPATTQTGKPSFDDAWFTTNTGIVDEVDWLYRIRAVKKEMSTFIEGIAANRHDDTGLLHGDFNNCLTRTGRLSSSNPNLQNLTNKSTLKKVFTSRYGEDGWIIEIDYSQLEVAVLACLSGDPQLLEDVGSGRDLHYETGKSVFGWADPSEMDKLDRRTVKGVNFGLIYGGGAKTISAQTGAPVHTVEKLIAAFYDRYPRVREWQEDNLKLVQDTAVWTSEKTASGKPCMTSQLVSPLGRVWKFTQEDPPWGGDPNFSPTRIKNYPVQGFATGDLVPIAVGLVAREVATMRLAGIPTPTHLTSTIHDSIILDVKGSESEARAQALHLAWVMSTLLERHIKQTYGIELPLKLKAEASIGRNWYDQKEI